MAKDDPNGRQGRRNQEMRDLRNELHGVRELNRELAQRNTDLEHAMSALLDGMNLFTDPPKEALQKICGMSALEAVRANIGKEVLVLSTWLNDMLVASGKFEIAHQMSRADTPEEIHAYLQKLREAAR